MAGLLIPLAVPGSPPHGSPPAWLGAFPHDPDRFTAIGWADKLAHPHDYRKLAQADALAQIGREISVRIESSSASTSTESGGSLDGSFSQSISAESRQELSGYRLLDTYETAEAFWALYALDKQDYSRAREEKARAFATWLDREAGFLRADLEARRIQGAMERFSRIREAYAGFAAGSATPGVSEAAASRFEDLSHRLATLVAGLRLAGDRTEWTFTPASGDRRLPGGWEGPGIFLIDAKTGSKWSGPLALTITDRRLPGGAACRLETDAEGEFDPTGLFVACGLNPGNWRVTWENPFEPLKLAVAGRLLKERLGILILDTARSGGVGLFPKAKESLEKELSALDNPFYSLVPGGDPSLEIRLRDVAMDSLDGIYFASLLGKARFPGEDRWETIQGKAGHSNPDQARLRAVRDFARGLGKCLGPDRIVIARDASKP